MREAFAGRLALFSALTALTCFSLPVVVTISDGLLTRCGSCDAAAKLEEQGVTSAARSPDRRASRRYTQPQGLSMSARYAALIAGVVLLVAGVSLLLAPAEASGPYPFGDANCDGAVDQADGLVVLREVAGVPGDDGCSAPQSVDANLDVDCDGELTVQDALLLFLHAARTAGRERSGVRRHRLRHTD